MHVAAVLFIVMPQARVNMRRDPSTGTGSRRKKFPHFFRGAVTMGEGLYV